MCMCVYVCVCVFSSVKIKGVIYITMHTFTHTKGMIDDCKVRITWLNTSLQGSGFISSKNKKITQK